MKILVTEGNNRAALAITRSLGKSGHKIYVGSDKSRSLSSVSQYCHKSFIYPNPTIHPDEFIECIRETCVANNIDVLLPVSDITTLLVTKHKNQLPVTCQLPFPDYGTLSTAADKVALFRKAKQLNIPIPKTIEITKFDKNVLNTININYPLVIKPGRSRVSTKNGWLSTNVTYAHNKDDLERQLADFQESIYPVMLQEKIQGPGVGIFVCSQHGQIVAMFSHKRIREKPPSGGVSVLRESTEIHPSARQSSIKLIKDLNWHGVAMIEFKIDSETGTPVLMEINGRFWGSLQLAIDSKIDFPNILINTLSNKQLPMLDTYPLGIKSRWFWGDVDLLLILLFKSRNKLNLPDNYPGRILNIINFMRIFEKDLHYEILKVHDLRPWLLESWRWITGKN